MTASDDGPRSQRSDETAIEPFVAHRALLFTVAYEMLGSVADAEDVVQETWLRWSAADRKDVRDARAYLVRVATRQALNRLRSLQRRREEYVGPWLPEPLVTSGDVADDVELAESVSLAMLVVLESLGPVERAVFVLREVFGFDHDEISRAVDRSPEAVRQIAHRARAHVQARRGRGAPEAGLHTQVAERFFAAAAGGDLQQLMDVLAPDVVLLSDGGGRAKAALRPVAGPDKVARFLVGLAQKAGDVTVRLAFVNGRRAALVYVGGRLDVVATADTDGDRVHVVYLIRNPDKLQRLEEARSLTRA